jgi:hypothetical protein
MALITIPVEAATAAPPKQISIYPINGITAGTVRYTVPAGRVFNGTIYGAGTLINGQSIFFSVAYPVTLLAGTVVASQTTTENTSLIGVESAA